MTGRTFVIIGAGLTAAAAAFTLRREGFDGRVVLVGQEPHLPYQRPPLSKEYLRGDVTADRLSVYPESWYADHAVETRLGTRAARIIPADRAVELDGGRRLHADAVLLATGGRPRRLPTVNSQRLLYLRTIEDAQRIATHLGPGRRLIMVGAGFIGAEVAASARQAGTDVTMLEMLDVPLEHLLGKAMGQVCADIHRDHGVDLRTGERVESITDAADGVVVRTSTGDTVEGSAVILGVGMAPNVDIAEASGIATDDGVIVDEFCRTSLDEVYAAGDVANHWHPLYDRRVRVEHYDNAISQGAAAARNMLGRPEAYADPHWFWSDQYEHNIQYAGSAEQWDDLVVRGSVDDCSFVAFYLRDRRVQAVLGINRGRDVRAAKRLLATVDVDPAQLRDESTDLRALGRAAA